MALLKLIRDPERAARMVPGPRAAGFSPLGARIGGTSIIPSSIIRAPAGGGEEGALEEEVHAPLLQIEPKL